MAATCASCGKPFGMSRRAVTTATGRKVCEGCRDTITATGAGAVANPGSPVAGGIATAGWFGRIRSWRRARRRS